MYIQMYVNIARETDRQIDRQIDRYHENTTSCLLVINTWTWAHDNHTSYAQLDELPEINYGDNDNGALFS